MAGFHDAQRPPPAAADSTRPRTPLSLGATASLLVAINCEIMLSKLLYKPAQTEWGWAATPVATSSEQQERGTPW